MSGLGTTVDPSGEPGSQTHNVIPQSETMPDQPGSIAQTTAIQTLDQLLHTNWIYDSTFTASTTMPAGTILFVKPIHPLQWNWPNKRVASMFNAWTGSGKVRYRPLATAWYGGSIRVGFLPPNMKMSEVYATPLEVLTSYPNKDIDPKNTTWVDFRGPDQREIAYHYMKEFDDSDRQSFGGYIVFYVAGKLVTQAPEFTTIQFIVELAGDFMYDQPSPRALSPSSVSSNPLGPLTEIPIKMQPLLDSADSGAGNTIQVNAVTTVQLTVGGIRMSAVGRPDALFKQTPGLSLLTTKLDPKQFNLVPSSTASYQRTDTPGTHNLLHTIKTTLPKINFEQSDLVYFANPKLPTAGTSVQAILPDGLNLDETDSIIGLKYKEATAIIETDEIFLRDNITRIPISDFNPVNPALMPTGAMTLAPIAGGESIVTFNNTVTRSMSAQTWPQAHFIGSWPQDMAESDTSYLYNLVNSNGTPLLTIRLNPNGMWTTNAVTSTVVYTADLMYLRYVGTLPVSSPLPTLGSAARNLQRDLARLTRKCRPEAIREIEYEISLA